jgi:Cu/Zn superoxide dismutase
MMNPRLAALLLVLGAAACGDDTAATSGAGGGGGSGTTSGTGSSTTTSSSGDGGAASTTSASQGGGDTGTGGAGEGGAGGDAATTGTGGAGGDDGTGGAGGAPGVSATANIAGQGITGTAVFTQVGDEVTLVIDVSGVTPDGNHAVHIHDNPACTGNQEDPYADAGGHWVGIDNPIDGANFDEGGGLGEIGDVPVAAGVGTRTITTTLWSVAPVGTDVMKNVVGHSFMVHAGPEDSPGAKIACGVIELD